MPNIKSAKKRVLINEKRARRNKSASTALKTAVKKADAAVKAGAENKEELVRDAVKKIDKASAKGIIHKNNAARKKSALALSLSKAGK